MSTKKHCHKQFIVTDPTVKKYNRLLTERPENDHHTIDPSNFMRQTTIGDTSSNSSSDSEMSEGLFNPATVLRTTHPITEAEKTFTHGILKKTSAEHPHYFKKGRLKRKQLMTRLRPDRSQHEPLVQFIDHLQAKLRETRPKVPVPHIAQDFIDRWSSLDIKEMGLKCTNSMMNDVHRRLPTDEKRNQWEKWSNRIRPWKRSW